MKKLALILTFIATTAVANVGNILVDSFNDMADARQFAINDATITLLRGAENATPGQTLKYKFNDKSGEQNFELKVKANFKSATLRNNLKKHAAWRIERIKNITPESIARLLEEEKAIIQGLLSHTFEAQSLNAFLGSPVGQSFYKQCDLTAAQGLLANDGSPLEINIWCQDRLINMAPGSRYRFHADPTGQMAQAIKLMQFCMENGIAMDSLSLFATNIYPGESGEVVVSVRIDEATAQINAAMQGHIAALEAAGISVSTKVKAQVQDLKDSIETLEHMATVVERDRWVIQDKITWLERNVDEKLFAFSQFLAEHGGVDISVDNSDGAAIAAGKRAKSMAITGDHGQNFGNDGDVQYIRGHYFDFSGSGSQLRPGHGRSTRVRENSRSTQVYREQWQSTGTLGQQFRRPGPYGN